VTSSQLARDARGERGREREQSRLRRTQTKLDSACVLSCVVLFFVILVVFFVVVVFFLKSRLHSNGDGDGEGGGKGLQYSERGLLGLKKHDAAASMSGWDLRALLASNWPSPNRQTTGRELKRLCHLQTFKKTGPSRKPHLITSDPAQGRPEMADNDPATCILYRHMFGVWKLYLFLPLSCLIVRNTSDHIHFMRDSKPTCILS